MKLKLQVETRAVKCESWRLFYGDIEKVYAASLSAFRYPSGVMKTSTGSSASVGQSADCAETSSFGATLGVVSTHCLTCALKGFKPFKTSRKSFLIKVFIGCNVKIYSQMSLRNEYPRFRSDLRLIGNYNWLIFDYSRGRSTKMALLQLSRSRYR